MKKCTIKDNPNPVTSNEAVRATLAWLRAGGEASDALPFKYNYSSPYPEREVDNQSPYVCGCAGVALAWLTGLPARADEAGLALYGCAAALYNAPTRAYNDASAAADWVEDLALLPDADERILKYEGDRS